MTSENSEYRDATPPATGEQDDAPGGGLHADDFSNETLDTSFLPQLDDTEFRRLDPRFRTVRVTTAALGWVIPTAAVIAGVILVSTPGVVKASAAIVLVILIAASLVLVRAEFTFRAWLVREHDISFRRGIVSRTVTTVPFSRVQHVSVNRGGIERVFGLASVEIFTAGSGSADLVISGLESEQAEQVKELVLQRTLDV